MQDVFIVSAVRTAIGKIGGTLAGVQPEMLAKISIEEAVKRARLEKELIDEVILGQTKQSADAANIARVAALMAKIPEHVPAYTVMRQCASGLQAVNNGAQTIKAGMADIVVAGGTESMSNAPFYLRNARYGYSAGNGVLVDSNTESQPRSQPIDEYGRLTMGMTAENLAEKYDISRREQDAFAHSSQQKADTAIKSGRFKDEIVPVTIPQRKGEPVVFDTDEHPRLSSVEKLSTLKAVFKEGGSVTAGNASGRNDGAACLVLMSEKEVVKRNIKPMARLVSQAAYGCSPEIMGIGPVGATQKALSLANLELADIGLIEINEAFAAQSLAVIKELEIDESIVNVNGGAIALGHPLGCSGARILTTLIFEMKKRKVKYGLATICVAGGQGVTDIIEMV